MKKNRNSLDELNIPVATMSTSDMIASGAQAFRMPDGSLRVTREWLACNESLLNRLYCEWRYDQR